MEDLLSFAVGVGLVLSLAFSELLGITAGGMIVPGYFSLFLNRPLVIILTLFVSYFAYLVVKAFSAVFILYGRRRIAFTILTGFLLGYFVRSLGSFNIAIGVIDLTIVGYIIPGLIALWIDRQGLFESICSLLIASVIVRLILILATGGDLQI